jgi:hypothetical protein
MNEKTVWDWMKDDPFVGFAVQRVSWFQAEEWWTVVITAVAPLQSAPNVVSSIAGSFVG